MDYMTEARKREEAELELLIKEVLKDIKVPDFSNVKNDIWLNPIDSMQSSDQKVIENYLDNIGSSTGPDYAHMSEVVESFWG